MGDSMNPLGDRVWTHTWVVGLIILALGWADSQAQVKRVINLGESVSRPTLTYAQVGDEIHAAFIVGCGDDPDTSRSVRAANNVMGRCVLVVKHRIYC